MARLETWPLAALYAALIAAGVLAGVIGATVHLAVESVIDWAREADVSPIADLVVNTLAAHPIVAILAPSSVVAILGWFGTAALLDRLEERRDRQAAAARRQADLDTCNAILRLPSPRKETP